MTRDEILSEPAGPRLDAWVAEHVMGWTPTGLAKDFNGVPFPEPIPNYSTDIAAAWEVVELVGGFEIEQWGDVWEKKGTIIWAASFNLPDGKNIVHATAATAPLAICRAALLAMMEGGR